MAYDIVNVDATPCNVLPSGIAGVAIDTGELVYLDSNGAYQLADQVADSDTTRKDALGVAYKDVQASEIMSPVRIARIKGFTGLTIGGKLYLSDTAGAMTQTEPTTNTRQAVGFAASATEVFVAIGGAGADEEVGGNVDAVKLTVSSTASFSGDITLADEVDIIANATTGTKIGTATTQKIGFWNVAPVVQPASADQADQGDMTTAGDNTGTGGAGLSLIGNTTSVDQAANLMNDFKAVNEDIAALDTIVTAIRAALVASGAMKGGA